jgi:hypothetical protein
VLINYLKAIISESIYAPKGDPLKEQYAAGMYAYLALQSIDAEYKNKSLEKIFAREFGEDWRDLEPYGGWDPK